MEDARKVISFKFSHHELVWLIEKSLETGNFEELFEGQVEDVDVQKVLERIALAHENMNLRCKAIQQIRDVNMLDELVKKSQIYRVIGDAAQGRLEALNKGQGFTNAL